MAELEPHVEELDVTEVVEPCHRLRSENPSAHICLTVRSRVKQLKSSMKSATIGPLILSLLLTVSVVGSCGDGGQGPNGSETAIVVPGAPSSLAATSGDPLITLSWNAPASSGAITGYKIFRDTATGVSVAGTPLASNSNAEVTYEDSTVAMDTNYYYKVVAYNPAGDGAESNEASASIISAPACGNEVGNGLTIVSGPSGPSGEDRDEPFRSLTVFPDDANTLILGTERNGFVKTTDGGTTWTRHRAGLRHTNGLYPEIWNIAVFSEDASILLAAALDSPGPITGDYPSTIGGIYKSVDGGNTWSRKNCGLSNSRITSVNFDATDSNIAVAGVAGGTASFSELAGQYFDGGMYRTTDGGENWTQVTLGSTDSRNTFLRIIARGGSPTTFLTFGLNYDGPSENLGFFRSSDSGSSWSALSGSDLTNLLITSFSASGDGTTIFANERDSYVVRISSDSGSTWGTTSINQANGPVAISPVDSNIVLYAGTANLYRSTDGLATNTVVLSAAAGIRGIVFAPSDPTVVYAVTTGYYLYKSSDSGATFSLVKNIRSDVLNVIP